MLPRHYLTPFFLIATAAVGAALWARGVAGRFEGFVRRKLRVSDEDRMDFDENRGR